jgi:hypothetical protein
LILLPLFQGPLLGQSSGSLDRRHRVLRVFGQLAIFYKDFGYSSGLVKLGTIDAGLDRLNALGSLKATIKVTK